MPRRIAMSTLVTRCQQRADKVGDDHLTEWNSLISEVYAADVFSVVAGTGLRYFEYVVTLTTTGAAYVSEPDDHLSTIRLDYVDSSGRHIEVEPINVDEEGKLAGLPASADRAYYYTLVDDRIYLYPTPPTGQTYEMLYIPQSPDLNDYAADDLVDVVTPDGEACLYWGVALLARAKASQDVALHMRKHEQHRTRLQEWAAERSLTQMQTRAVDKSDRCPTDRW